MAIRSINATANSIATPAPSNATGITARERKRLETRQRIFDAAMAEFREVGFQAAQIDRIVERAGVARGTFYFHFRTKEHVLLQEQSKQEADVLERLRAMGPPPDSVPEYLKRLLICMLGGREEDGELGREIMAMYIRSPVDIQLADQPLITEVLDYFSEAADRGAIRRDIPPEVLAVRFLGSFFHLAMGDVLDLEDEETLEQIDVAIDIYFNGLKFQEV